MIIIDEKIDHRIVYKIAHSNEELILSENLKYKVIHSRKVLENKIKNAEVIYGVNTGFGRLANNVVKEYEKLQLNLIRSHAVGVGDELEREISRAILFLKLHNLGLGFSGVRYDIIDRILFFLNNAVYPVIPKYGSVGASGDLVPLSHMALTLIGEGFVYLNKSYYPSLIAHKILNIEPLILKEKEGLALINGLEFSKALLSIALFEFEKLFEQSITIFLFSAYAFNSNKKHYDLRLMKAKKGEGFSRILEILNKYTQNLDGNRIQDPYSFRTTLQIYAAIYDNLRYVESKTNEELNSVSDNPIIVDDEVISAGLFQGQQIAFLADFLNINLIKLSHLSERRTFQLLKEYEFLTKNPGINSGFMMFQVSQASLLNSMNTYPHSVDNITTNEFQEDIVSFSSNSTLNLYENVKKAYYILAYELVSSLQALYLTKHYEKLPTRLREIYEELRIHKTHPIKVVEEDRDFKRDIDSALYHLKNFKLIL